MPSEGDKLAWGGRKPKRESPSRQLIKKMYASGMTTQEIADELWMDWKGVNRHRRAAGIPIPSKRNDGRYRWTADEIAQARGWWAGGDSAEICAASATRKFGRRITRNAIIGLAYRQGWERRRTVTRVTFWNPIPLLRE